MKILLLFIYCISTLGQSEINEQQREVVFYKATKKWFSAWKLLSKNIYKVKIEENVEFGFFDDKYVYSNSSITIKNGSSVKGHNLKKKPIEWRKAIHNNSIVLPDLNRIPIGIMCFAKSIPIEQTKS